MLLRRVPIALLPLLTLLAASCGSAGPDRPGVHVLVIDGVINAVSQRYLERGLSDAEDAQAALAVIQLDTPGGFDSAMREMVQRITSASVPVAVYVYPAGARAGSAGTFITVAAHIAAMTPGSNIGAAHPVGAGGEDIEGTLGEKIENDAAALIRSLATLRGRNPEWAEAAVRESKSYSAEEALEAGGIDLLAPDLPTLLRSVDGREVMLPGGSATVDTSGQEVVFNRMTRLERLLYAIADPNIAFILLSLGALGIFVELLNPGVIFPGAFGTIALIFSFFALGNLDVNLAGVALILVAFVLFFLEVFVASFGTLTLGGIASLALGGLLLTSGSAGAPTVSRMLVFATAAGIGLALAAFMTLILRVRKQAARVGAEVLVGKKAVARTRLDPEGFVFVQGERWRAVTDGETVEPGEAVVIRGLEGLRLSVRRPATVEASSPSEGS